MGVEDDLERLIEERMVPVRRLLADVDPERSAQAVVAAVGEILQIHVEALRLIARAVDRMSYDQTSATLENVRQQIDEARKQYSETMRRQGQQGQTGTAEQAAATGSSQPGQPVPGDQPTPTQPADQPPSEAPAASEPADEPEPQPPPPAERPVEPPPAAPEPALQPAWPRVPRAAFRPAAPAPAPAPPPPPPKGQPPAEPAREASEDPQQHAHQQDEQPSRPANPPARPRTVGSPTPYRSPRHLPGDVGA